MASIVSQFTRALPAPAYGGWLIHARELGLYLGLYLLYLLLRGLALGGEKQAHANTQHIIDLESSAGFFAEPALQAWALANAPALVVFLNWIYIITYWPVIVVVAIALYLARRHIYYRYRNLIVAHLVLALVLFVLFPLAPPFKTDSLVDTIQGYGPVLYGSPAMATFYNTNAAMPSLHFSWTCIFAWLFVREVRGWYRYLGLGYPLLTLAAIIVTGNHYFLDAIVGALLIPVAFGFVVVCREWTRELFSSGAST